MQLTPSNKITQFALILIAFCCSVTTANSQSVILEQDVNKDTVISNYGKNKTKYFGSQVGLGGMVQDATGSKSLRLLSSSIYQYGFYYKLRANNVYSVLGHASYNRLNYSFNTASADIHYEKLMLNNASLGLMNRFNFGRRGNFIGYYVSVGASAEYTLTNKIRSKMDAVPGSDFKFSKISRHNLDYINKLNYNAEIRIGLNKAVIFGKYRLTDPIKKSQDFQLPPTVVGLMFDFGA